MSTPEPREVVETLHLGWWPISDEDSPSLCTCGHLHYLRQCFARNEVSWGFCEDPECRCTCLRREQAKGVSPEGSGGQS